MPGTVIRKQGWATSWEVPTVTCPITLGALSEQDEADWTRIMRRRAISLRPPVYRISEKTEGNDLMILAVITLMAKPNEWGKPDLSMREIANWSRTTHRLGDLEAAMALVKERLDILCGEGLIVRTFRPGRTNLYDASPVLRQIAERVDRQKSTADNRWRKPSATMPRWPSQE